ncbi:MAG: Holliday junction branch migration protein RuvA [Lachnospiraceae bacterium]|nr:Holliday junction branch migration protein RuvA [Lachnospiraceae bacterium]
MIRFVKGTLVFAGEGEVIVENNGIGLGISVPMSVAGQLPSIGEEVMLYTYMNVREDAMQLFGFLTPEDLKMYKLLITVNGIGPKAGLGIMGAMSSYDIRYAIMAGDAKAIARAPGIGPKTAGKVILELKDKMEWEDMLPEGEAGHVPEGNGAGPVPPAEVVQDAVEALTVLGYPKMEAVKAVRAVEFAEDMTVEELLKQSLKKM